MSPVPFAAVRTAHASKFVCAFDALEPRRLLTATVVNDTSGTVTLQGDTLYVFGTSADDVITAAVNRHGRVAVTIAAPSAGDGTPLVSQLVSGDTPRLSDVSKIYVSGGAGDDVINLSGLSITAEIHGDTGNDIIYGGNAGDTLYGDSGDDFITDGRGNDLLIGGAGKDTLRSLHGIDTLLGQAGDDRLIEHGNETAVNGGTGTDIATLDGIPDGIVGVESYSSDSAYLPTSAGARAGSVTTTDASGAVLLNATLSSRYRNGYAFDWDISDTTNGGLGNGLSGGTAGGDTGGLGGVSVSATPFLLNTSVFGVNAISQNFRQTFDVGPVSGLGTSGVDVNFTSNGLSLFSGFMGVAGTSTDPAFSTAIGNGSTFPTTGTNFGVGNDGFGTGVNTVIPTRDL